MKVAIPTAEGLLCQHFGHCQVFTIFEADPEAKTIQSTETLTPPPHEPGVLPRWLSELGANLIIAGGMGRRAIDLFTENGVKVIVGAQPGKPEEVLQAWMDGSLVTGGNLCDH